MSASEWSVLQGHKRLQKRIERKRIIHCPSYCHKCTPVCRAFVGCLFVKFVRTICFLKQTHPFSNSQALFGDSSHTKESFDYCKWVKQDNRPEPHRWSCFCYSCKHPFTYLKDCTVWVLFVGTVGPPAVIDLSLTPQIFQHVSKKHMHMFFSQTYICQIFFLALISFLMQ